VLQLMRDHVQKGQVGVRSGQGFYEWDDAHRARVKEGRKRLIHHTAKKTGKHS